MSSVFVTTCFIIFETKQMVSLQQWLFFTIILWYDIIEFLDPKYPTNHKPQNTVWLPKRPLAAILDFMLPKFPPTLLRDSPWSIVPFNFHGWQILQNHTLPLHGHGLVPDDPIISNMHQICASEPNWWWAITRQFRWPLSPAVQVTMILRSFR